jgi:deazaflavin-dependent oxidoreductase (nitroreductase family)
MAKTFRKTPVQRVGTVFMTRMILLGVGGKGMTLLTVPDEESGSMQSTPVTVIDHGSDRWLVAPYGVTRWVRNARAAGRVELRRGRRREHVSLVEVGPDDGAPVLREYVRRVAMVRPYVDVDPDGSDEAFAAQVPTHPVFRIAGPAP